MNREGAETYLRLLAEAAVRAHARGPAPAEGPGGGQDTMITAGQALIAVGALDVATVEEITADFYLAISVRPAGGQTAQGAAGSRRGPAGTTPRSARTLRAAAMAHWAAQSQSVRSGPLARARTLTPVWPLVAGGSPGPPDPEPGGREPDRCRADRFVPVGLTIPFRYQDIRGNLYLMSFARTASGARFTAVWDVPAQAPLYLMRMQRPGLVPFGPHTVTDDRGARYQLEWAPGGEPEWTGEIRLCPDPPDDIRWLDVAPPLGPVVRVNLRPANPADAEAQVSDVRHSPGERLLVMLAERLLTAVPDFPHDRPRPGMTRGPLEPMVSGLGDIVAALEAADVLSPLSPVPARLAALCASLDIGGHGIAVPPAHDLPEPWLSLLAHYQRRKPDLAPMRDGYAVTAADLPELDGIRLALLGLQHTGGSSSLRVLARGLMPVTPARPLGVNLAFPLSVWLRDSGGRWHAAHPAGMHATDRDYMVRLQLVPPLTRCAEWVEVLAGGRSAEVRTRLPLHWRYPP